MNDLIIGTTVTWTSQAQGGHTTKTGVIVQVVSPGELPNRDAFLSLYKGAGVGGPRNAVSYVVSVQIGKRKPKYYWPLASKLEIVNGI